MNTSCFNSTQLSSEVAAADSYIMVCLAAGRELELTQTHTRRRLMLAETWQSKATAWQVSRRFTLARSLAI